MSSPNLCAIPIKTLSIGDHASKKFSRVRDLAHEAGGRHRGRRSEVDAGLNIAHPPNEVPIGGGDHVYPIRRNSAQGPDTRTATGSIEHATAFNQGLDIACLLYTSDAADDLLCVDLGGR